MTRVRDMCDELTAAGSGVDREVAQRLRAAMRTFLGDLTGRMPPMGCMSTVPDRHRRLAGATHPARRTTVGSGPPRSIVEHVLVVGAGEGAAAADELDRVLLVADPAPGAPGPKRIGRSVGGGTRSASTGRKRRLLVVVLHVEADSPVSGGRRHVRRGPQETRCGPPGRARARPSGAVFRPLEWGARRSDYEGCFLGASPSAQNAIIVRSSAR